MSTGPREQVDIHNYMTNSTLNVRLKGEFY